MNAIVEVRGLTKHFHNRHGDSFTAVDDLTFAVEEGECLAVVGESGSGKSTTARILAGLEQPSAGQILVAGEPRPPLPWPRTRRRAHARAVQMVYQDPLTSLDPQQSVEAGLAEILAFHDPDGAPQRRERTTQLLEQVGLQERHLARRPGDLSGGERQRVALARALAVQPTVLVLDEAVSALDVSVQAQVLNLLDDLRAELGLSYLFITHDLGVVRQVADRCLVMLQGRQVETGPTEQVLSRPRHEYTRQLLAAVPGPGWTPTRRTAAVG